MATGYLVTISMQVLMLMLRIGSGGYVPLLGRLIPGDKSSLKVNFAAMSSFMGIPLPRTTLYTPDPPILGICALLCFFICLGETNHRLRNFALAGSLCALLVSISRLGWVCFVVGLLISAVFNSRLIRQLSLWSASLTLLLCSFMELTFGELVEKPIEVFNGARSSSSAERAIVVRKTLEAWQEEPWLGWGVSRGRAWLYEDVYMGLGAFSTYSAVLYLHGIVGFIFLVCAMLFTLLFFWNSAIRGNLACKRAIVSLVTLYISCNATPLSWMAVNMWFFFVWLGALMYETQQRNMALSSWEQLSGQN
jgi:hypothetical protein